ncbi:MAG: multicopper oxidase domain-containing protein [bacterium]|nr:multicopper oxidase domain-containing protein [bacterium]
MRTFFLIMFAVIIAVALTAFRLRSAEPAQVVHHEYSAMPAKKVDVKDIRRAASDIPPPITRQEAQVVKFELETKEVVAEVAPGTTYEYWTYNGTVPGPFLRVREGDMVEIKLTHLLHEYAKTDGTAPPLALGIMPAAFADGEDAHMDMGGDEHEIAGHGTHSIDLHAVIGPGGGATLMQAKSGEMKVFQFKATRPGLYVYHCASPHIPTHVANGMYGLILVEPAGGMPKVDREFYVMQGELYTQGHVGQKGHQEFSKEKLLAEAPEYVVFNGRMGALTGNGALKAKTGEKIRLFVGVGTFLASNFHVIGGVLDHLYPEGDLVSPPHRNVQTTLIPAGGSAVVEFELDVPGKYLLVDHSLVRAIDRGALAELIVEGSERPELFGSVKP